MNSASCRIISIDGPAGSGKSTIAKQLAQKLGFIHADSGAIYRTLTRALMDQLGPGQDPEDFGKRIGNLSESDIQNLKIEIGIENGIQVNRINGNDAGESIRTPEVTSRIKFIADTMLCREEVNRLLRQFSLKTDLVADGRDIGSVVFPETPYKFFLEASIEIRAERRKKDFIKQGNEIPLAEIIKDIQKRDEEDRNRPVGALICPKDAILIDTSTMSTEVVLGCLMSEMQLQF
ncbi:MAG: (d)CMP kinase [Spirochaetia bacterium]|nr:(d)CMP kinase [Spirochaetia bacterium]